MFSLSLSLFLYLLALGAMRSVTARAVRIVCRAILDGDQLVTATIGDAMTRANNVPGIGTGLVVCRRRPPVYERTAVATPRAASVAPRPGSSEKNVGPGPRTIRGSIALAIDELPDSIAPMGTCISTGFTPRTPSPRQPDRRNEGDCHQGDPIEERPQDCWGLGHGVPRFKRICLDEASLLLRCLHPHLRVIGEQKLEAYIKKTGKHVKMPKSGLADPESVTKKWVRPCGVKLLSVFEQMDVDIMTAPLWEKRSVLVSWLWPRVSTHSKKRHLTPEDAESRSCRAELGWPGFWITIEEFNTVIDETMTDYGAARRIVTACL